MRDLCSEMGDGLGDIEDDGRQARDERSKKGLRRHEEGKKERVWIRELEQNLRMKKMRFHYSTDRGNSKSFGHDKLSTHTHLIDTFQTSLKLLPKRLRLHPPQALRAAMG